MIHLPTGSGKTKTAMEIICDFMRSRVTLGGFNVNSKNLWLAHSEELCDQAYYSFIDQWTLRGDSSCNVYKFFGKNQLPEEYDNDKIFLLSQDFKK